MTNENYVILNQCGGLCDEIDEWEEGEMEEFPCENCKFQNYLTGAP